MRAGMQQREGTDIQMGRKGGVGGGGRKDKEKQESERHQILEALSHIP